MWCCWPLCLQVYYPVRHHLVQHMVSAMQRLGFTPSVTIEQRRLAVDLSEVVIKWELQRIKDQQVGLLAFAVISLWAPYISPGSQAIKSGVSVCFSSLILTWTQTPVERVSTLCHPLREDCL